MFCHPVLFPGYWKPKTFTKPSAAIMHASYDRPLLPSNTTKFEWAANRQSLSAESVDAAMHPKNTLIVWSKLLGKQDSASSVWNLLTIQNRSIAPQHLVLIDGFDNVLVFAKPKSFCYTEPRRSPRTRGQAQCIHIAPYPTMPVIGRGITRNNIQLH